jgi:4-alpha-glucanotransferase
MKFPRASGILLHPTSLPGRYGIGDLGTYAYKFVDRLESTDQTLWQILPLGPTSYGDSPYQTLSAFAGNPLLVSFDQLVADGWLTAEDVANVPPFPAHQVDFGWVIVYKDEMLTKAYQRFEKTATPEQRKEFEDWCAKEASWLDDYALFVALKDSFGGKPWTEWDLDVSLRDSSAISAARTKFASRMADHKFRQWQFFKQWHALKKYANDRKIKLVGDIPIFVAHDSSDVWSNRDLFYLDERGNPTVIAGVPPDYFSETGQRWGNPLYRWDVLKKTGYQWWIDRIRSTLEVVDVVRIDHFRGFEAYWEIPATEPTAVKGQWVPGPAQDLFDAIRAALGELPIIAEDLGVITPGVEALRDNNNLPGMKVLQFAFGADAYSVNSFLPHTYSQNSVVYTGTHDNNTTVGWWQSGEASGGMREHMRRYLGHDVTEVNWDLIRLGSSSVARYFVAPLQDVLGFGADTRMNTPGKLGGNWGWRFTAEWLDHHSWWRLADLTRLYSRHPGADV